MGCIAWLGIECLSLGTPYSSFSDVPSKLNFGFRLSQLIKKNVFLSKRVCIQSKWEQGWHFSIPGIDSCNLDSGERKVLR